METNLKKFFIIVLPGFEQAALAELQTKFSFYFSTVYLSSKIVKGGIEIETELENGLLLNYILKIPTKILLRVDEFKCKDVPKLYLKISKINWSFYLINSDIEVVTSAKNSRLFDSRKISKAVLDGVTLFINSNPLKKKSIDHYLKTKFKPTLYIRIEDDLCTVSLDSTGELLHLRGTKELTGLAPLRENLAAGLLDYLCLNLETKNYHLIDPLCGSGTFLIEAFNKNKLNDNRSFDFLNFPIYFNLQKKIKLTASNADNFISYQGFDLNNEIVLLARKNVDSRPIKIDQRDAFQKNSKNEINPNVPSLVITNPPYGIRVNSNISINNSFFLNLIEKIFLDYNPLRLGIIIPADYNISNFKHLVVINKIKFRNGGIPVIFYVFESK